MDNSGLMRLLGVWVYEGYRGGDRVRHDQLVWRISLGGGGPLFFCWSNNGTFEKGMLSLRDKAHSEHGEGRSGRQTLHVIQAC